ncbi:MAG: amidohydrolase family protein [Pseudomonadota bacterium]
MRHLFVADQVFDGERVIEGGAVLVEDNRIAAVGRQADLGQPEGARVHSAPTLLPGLIDAHVHLAFSGVPGRAAMLAEAMDQSYPEVALRAAERARDSLCHGITSLRDMAGPGGAVIDLARAVECGDLVGPRILACGRGLTVTGGHMDAALPDHVTMEDARAPCDGADGFRKGVRTEARRGAGFIKINSCVSLHTRPGTWWRPEMTPDEIAAVCDEAHAQDMIVAAHTSGGPPLTATVANGVDCVEHAHWIEDDCIELMAERGTFLVPTLLVNERTFEVPLAEQGLARIPPWSEAAREAKWISLAKARLAGLRVGAGTDAGFMLPHATMFWREVALLAEGGYTAVEALTAATAVNADIMGIEAGRLAPGRFADLVIFDGDPLADLSLLGDATLMTVWKGGAEVARGGALTTVWPQEMAA